MINVDEEKARLMALIEILDVVGLKRAIEFYEHQKSYLMGMVDVHEEVITYMHLKIQELESLDSSDED